MIRQLYGAVTIFFVCLIAYAENDLNGSQFTSQMKLTDSSPTVIWNQNFKQLVQVVAEPGYKILVTVNECLMNLDKSEYVRISSDPEGDENMIKLISTVSNKPAFLYNINELYAKFVGAENSSVILNFTRLGTRLITTTTEIPTTTIILPTPDPKVEKELTVYLKGWYSEEYKKPTSQNKIKQILSEATNEYCKKYNYDLVNNATISNVFLNISNCPEIWPDSEICASVTFEIPVLIHGNSILKWTGYQLTRQHLIKMWSQIGLYYLPKGLSIYNIPDTDEWFNEQVYLFSGLIVMCFICSMLIRYYSSKVVRPARRRKLSDTKSIISSKRDSINDLRPHPLQETPPLFENIYPMFNPVKTKVSHVPFTDDRANSMQKKDIEFADEDEDESNL